MHKCIQDFLQKKRTIPETKKYFWRWWRTFYRIYKKHLGGKQVGNLLRAGLNIISHAEESFKGCETLSTEERLEMPISLEHPELNFKGFVDLVMFRDNQLLIADLKTTKSAYMFEKYLDALKRHQLTFYKTYYARKHDIDLDDIDVCFIALEKAPTAKNPIQFLPETSGYRKIAKSQELITETINMVQRGEFPKNRNSCYDEKTKIKCPFFQTPHCPED